MSRQVLVDAYDAALFDLDGVVYLGPASVPGAPEGIRDLRARGTRVGFVTNNAARQPQVVVDQLVSLGVEAELADVVTSAQAGARMLATQLPAGSKVLVLGTQALAAEVEAVGMVVAGNSEDQPDAVIQGYDPTMTWPRLDDACRAIQHGARWFATNTDSTRPTDRGLVPGAGAQVAAVQVAVDTRPQVAGKPCTPLLEETVRRLGAERAIFVGDRLDTDIMGASAVGMDSLFVFTGAHGKHDLLAAAPHARPTAIGFDLRALLAAPRVAVATGEAVRVGEQQVHLDDGAVVLQTTPEGVEQELDALWAVLQLAWASPGCTTDVVDSLGLLP